MRAKLFWALLLLWPPLLLAQFTQVQGTITDPTGLPYANGTITPTLVISGSPRFASSGFGYTPPNQPVGLDSKGSFVMQLGDVTQLLPSGGTWSFHVCSAAGTVQPGSPITAGPICFDVTGLVISGTVQDISAPLSAAAPRLTTVSGSGGVTSINGTGGAFTFTGSGVNCVTTTCTFTGGAAGIGGSGTTNFIPVFTAASTVGNSNLTSTANQLTLGSTAFAGNPGIQANVNETTTTNCVGNNTIPLGTGANVGCLGQRLSYQNQAATSSGVNAGFEVNANGAATSAGTLGIGIYGAESATSAMGETRAGYFEASEGNGPAITTRRGLMGVAVNAGGTTTALNEGLVAQTGATFAGGVNSNDYSMHCLAPLSGSGTLATHACLRIEPQLQGVEFQTGAHVFANLPACTSTYEGSLAAINDSSVTSGTITGGGTNHVLGYCNASAWIVSSGGGGGVASINGATGAFTFSGPGASCVGSTCTFPESGPLSGLTAATALNTIDNGDFQQTWRWTLAGDVTGFTFGETAANTGSLVPLVGINSAASSNTTPLQLQQGPLTGTTSVPILNMNTTLNNAALSTNMIQVNATNTASSSTGTNFFQFNAGAAGNTLSAKMDLTGNLSIGGVLAATTVSNVLRICGSSAVTCNGNQAGGVGAALIQGGDNANATASSRAGAAFIRGGLLSAASPNAAAMEGTVQVGMGFMGTSGAAFNTVCMTTTSLVVADCSNTGPAANVVGISTSTVNPVTVIVDGAVPVNLDNTAVIGDFICRGTITAGQNHDNGTTACTAGLGIGIVIATSGTFGTLSGATSTTQVVSTTTPLVMLHFR